MKHYYLPDVTDESTHFTTFASTTYFLLVFTWIATDAAIQLIFDWFLGFHKRLKSIYWNEDFNMVSFLSFKYKRKTS